MDSRRIAGPVATLALALVLAGCGGAAATAAPTTAPTDAPAASEAGGGSGGVDCGLLSAADFTAAGIQGAGAPSDNPDGTSHYCVYAGSSGATGGIELDVFLDASVGDAQATYETARDESGAMNGQPPAGATFDEASYAVADGAALLVGRQGLLTFALSAPATPASEAALVALGTLVVQRAGGSVGP